MGRTHWIVVRAVRPPRPGGGMGGMFGGQQPPPEQKADGGRAIRLTEALGVRWDYDRVVFDINNPHPEFGMLILITPYEAQQAEPLEVQDGDAPAAVTKAVN